MKFASLILFIAFKLFFKVRIVLKHDVDSFLCLPPIDLELQPVSLSDGLMDVHVPLDLDTFSSSTQVFLDLISFNGH